MSMGTVGLYEKVEFLGAGAYGKVYKVLKEGDDAGIYALKQVPISNMSEKDRADMLNEIQMLSKCSHFNIIQYHESFILDEHLNIVMEYADGGDLSHRIRSAGDVALSEEMLWNYLIQIAQGLEHLHMKRIIHRDINPRNVLVTRSDNIKIGDMGLCKFLASARYAHSMCGTPLYTSPEIINEVPYNEKADIWSFGCLMYELATLRPPFVAKTQAALAKKILTEEPARIPPEKYSFELTFLINKMLSKDPHKRPSVSDILKCSAVQFRLHRAIALRNQKRLLNENARLRELVASLSRDPVPTLHDHDPSMIQGSSIPLGVDEGTIVQELKLSLQAKQAQLARALEIIKEKCPATLSVYQRPSSPSPTLCPGTSTADKGIMTDPVGDLPWLMEMTAHLSQCMAKPPSPSWQCPLQIVPSKTSTLVRPIVPEAFSTNRVADIYYSRMLTPKSIKSSTTSSPPIIPFCDDDAIPEVTIASSPCGVSYIDAEPSVTAISALSMSPAAMQSLALWDHSLSPASPMALPSCSPANCIGGYAGKSQRNGPEPQEATHGTPKDTMPDMETVGHHSLMPDAVVTPGEGDSSPPILHSSPLSSASTTHDRSQCMPPVILQPPASPLLGLPTPPMSPQHPASDAQPPPLHPFAMSDASNDGSERKSVDSLSESTSSMPGTQCGFTGASVASLTPKTTAVQAAPSSATSSAQVQRPQPGREGQGIALPDDHPNAPLQSPSPMTSVEVAAYLMAISPPRHPSSLQDISTECTVTAAEMSTEHPIPHSVPPSSASKGTAEFSVVFIRPEDLVSCDPSPLAGDTSPTACASIPRAGDHDQTNITIPASEPNSRRTSPDSPATARHITPGDSSTGQQKCQKGPTPSPVRRKLCFPDDVLQGSRVSPTQHLRLTSQLMAGSGSDQATSSRTAYLVSDPNSTSSSPISESARSPSSQCVTSSKLQLLMQHLKKQPHRDRRLQSPKAAFTQEMEQQSDEVLRLVAQLNKEESVEHWLPSQRLETSHKHTTVIPNRDSDMQPSDEGRKTKQKFTRVSEAPLPSSSGTAVKPQQDSIVSSPVRPTYRSSPVRSEARRTSQSITHTTVLQQTAGIAHLQAQLHQPMMSSTSAVATTNLMGSSPLTADSLDSMPADNESPAETRYPSTTEASRSSPFGRNVHFADPGIPWDERPVRPLRAPDFLPAADEMPLNLESPPSDQRRQRRVVASPHQPPTRTASQPAAAARVPRTWEGPVEPPLPAAAQKTTEFYSYLQQQLHKLEQVSEGAVWDFDDLPEPLERPARDDVPRLYRSSCISTPAESNVNKGSFISSSSAAAPEPQVGPSQSRAGEVRMRRALYTAEESTKSGQSLQNSAANRAFLSQRRVSNPNPGRNSSTGSQTGRPSASRVPLRTSPQAAAAAAAAAVAPRTLRVDRPTASSSIKARPPSPQTFHTRSHSQPIRNQSGRGGALTSSTFSTVPGHCSPMKPPTANSKRPPGQTPVASAAVPAAIGQSTTPQPDDLSSSDDDVDGRTLLQRLREEQYA